MKRIRKETRVGACYLSMYKKALANSVTEFYKAPSALKKAAERALLSLLASERGHGYKIISGNSFYFTAAWQNADGLRIETAGNSYLIF